MSISVFEVTPSSNLEDRFIYTIDTTDGDLLPFSATTLRQVMIPDKAEFKKIRGSLTIKKDSHIAMKKGCPYIVITPTGPAITWWIEGKFNIQDSVSDYYLLKIPKSLTVAPKTTQIESIPLKYPESNFDCSKSSLPHANLTPVAPKPFSLDEVGSPSPQYASTDLHDKVAFLTSLLESYLRREYKLYSGMTCPERFLVNGQSIPISPLSQIQDMMGRGEIDRFEQNPLFQPFAGSPRTSNRFLTFYDKKGQAYIVKASYDPTTNQLGPPA